MLQSFMSKWLGFNHSKHGEGGMIDILYLFYHSVLKLASLQGSQAINCLIDCLVSRKTYGDWPTARIITSNIVPQIFSSIRTFGYRFREKPPLQEFVYHRNNIIVWKGRENLPIIKLVSLFL